MPVAAAFPLEGVMETGTRTGRRFPDRRSRLPSVMEEGSVSQTSGIAGDPQHSHKTKNGSSPGLMRSRQNFQPNLERDLGRKLHPARAAAAEKRIADAHIARRRKRQETDAPPRCVQAVVCRIGNEIRQVRIGKVGMIQQVEELGPDLQIYPLGDRRVLEHRKVEFLEIGRAQRVASQISEVASARAAVAVAAVAKARSVAESARHLERRKIHARSAAAIPDRAQPHPDDRSPLPTPSSRPRNCN